MKKDPRKLFFVDAHVQGALLVRATIYSALCLVVVTGMVLCWRILTGPARVFYTHFDDMWFHFAPGLIATLLLLPLVLLDLAKLTNRFAGPMVRLRASMRALTRGETVEPLRFRKGDFWQEAAEEFNSLATQVAQMRSELAERQGREGADAAEPAEPIFS